MVLTYLPTVLILIHCIFAIPPKHTSRNTRASGCYTAFSNDSSLIPLVTLGEKSYYIGTTFKATYLEATKFCQLINMKLVSITSEAENKKLHKYLIGSWSPQTVFWSSGYKAIDGQTWVWMSTGKRIDYTNWRYDQPDHTDLAELCIFLQKQPYDLYWHDNGCDKKLSFICEKYNVPCTSAHKPPILPTIRHTNITVAEKATQYPENPSLPETSVDGKKYRFSKYRMTQDKADQLCNQYGMQLVSMADEENNDIVANLISQSEDSTSYGCYWNSRRRQSDGQWHPEPITYNAYAEEFSDVFPDDDCLKFPRRMWDDVNCIAKCYLICESPKLETSNRNYSTHPVANTCAHSNRTDSTSIAVATEYPENPSLSEINVDGWKFRISKYKVTHDKAEQICNQYGMKLVSIADRNKTDIVINLIRHTEHSATGDDYWTSARKQSDGKWVWWNLQHTTFTNWAQGEPNNAAKNEDCLTVFPTGEWNDENCTKEFYFICESTKIRTPVICSSSQSVANTYVNNNTETGNPSIATANEGKPEKNAAQYPDNPSLPETNLGGRKYRVSKYKATQNEAGQICEQYGMKLVSINGRNENDVVTNLIRQSQHSTPGENYWTSAKKQSDGKWTWWDLRPITYNNWDVWEPNNLYSNENCLQIFPTGIWNDISCITECYFICQSTKIETPDRDYTPQPVVNIYVDNNNVPGSPSIARAPEGKPENAAQYPDNPSLPEITLGGRKYRVSKYIANYDEADRVCKEYGMNLVSIKDESKTSIVINLIHQTEHTATRDFYWSSGRKQSDGKWVWWDHQPMAYTNWDIGEPNNLYPNEACLQIFPSGKWNDRQCIINSYFICESPKAETPDGGCSSQPVVNIYVHNIRPASNNTSTAKAPVVKSTNAETAIQYPYDPSLPETSLGGRKYRISKYKTTHDSAGQTCRLYGMKLVSVADKNKNDDVSKLMLQSEHSSPYDYYWSSGRKQLDGKWVFWNNRPITYTNWAPREPYTYFNGDETCLQLYPNGEWNGGDCSSQCYFICEIPETEVESSETPDGSSSEIPDKDSSWQSVVNVYVNSNQCCNNSHVPASDPIRIYTSKDGKGFNIEVNSNIGTIISSREAAPGAV